MQTIVGNCKTCGAPIYSPAVWSGILPPPSNPSCLCQQATRFTQGKSDLTVKLDMDTTEATTKLGELETLLDRIIEKTKLLQESGIELVSKKETVGDVSVENIKISRRQESSASDDEIRLGDKVRMKKKGSWVDGKIGTVTGLEGYLDVTDKLARINVLVDGHLFICEVGSFEKI